MTNKSKEPVSSCFYISICIRLRMLNHVFRKDDLVGPLKAFVIKSIGLLALRLCCYLRCYRIDYPSQSICTSKYSDQFRANFFQSIIL